MNLINCRHFLDEGKRGVSMRGGCLHIHHLGLGVRQQNLLLVVLLDLKRHKSKITENPGMQRTYGGA